MSFDFSSFSSDELQKVLNNDIFRAMVNAMPIGIAFLKATRDKHKAIIGFDFTYRNLVADVTPDGKTAETHIDAAHPLFNVLLRVTNSGVPEDFTSDDSNDDNHKQTRYTARKFNDGVVLTSIENTDTSKAEQKIISLNKSLKTKNRELQSLNNELKTFTSIAAFDYKDTLKTLYTNLEYIISHDARNFSNTGRANLRKAQTAIQKMKLLTDDIVAFSNIQVLDDNASPVDLNKVLKDVTKELDEKMFEVTFEKENLPVVNGYPFLIDLLFFHILDNALKFRSPDRPCHIRVSHHITKERNTDHDMHQISFIDNGIGFEQEEADKIFEMFYRIHDKKYKGSGIGLAICKKIMTLHGGTMAVESEPGKGSAFCCFFPA
jgi:signal transduction histidine kinase